MNRSTLVCAVLAACLWLSPSSVPAIDRDTCETPTVIAALPYLDVGNSCAPGIVDAQGLREMG